MNETPPDRQYRPGEPRPRLRAPGPGRPHAAPWQGPPPQRPAPDTPWSPWTPKTALAAFAIGAVAVLIMCGILAWFLADVIPG